jgi:hypothetical protein
MSPTDASSRSPNVPIELVVHPALGRLGDELHNVLRAEVSAELGRLLRRLGIPGTPEVRIRVEDAAPDVWARIFVNGHRCRHPEELSWRVRTYMLGGPGDVRPKDGVVPWLQELLGDAHAARAASRFCRLAVAETVKGRLSVLLGDEQAAAYARRLRTRPDLTWLRPVLGEVLDLKTSIADTRTVGRLLETAEDFTPGEARERLLAKLRPDVVQVRLTEAYARELTLAPGAELANRFGRLRDELFEELGVPCPPLRLVIDEHLRERAFAVTINHVTLLPWIGLQPDECLVGRGPVEAQAAGLEVLGQAVDPGTGQLHARIRLEQQPAAERESWTTWTPLGFLSLALAADLRSNAPCLIDQTTVRTQLSSLVRLLPALVQPVLERFPDWELTKVLRSLVAERVGVRDAWLLFERLVDADDGTTIREDQLAAWCRSVLAPATVDRRSGSTGTVEVYEVAAEVEHMLRQGGRALDQRDQDRILDAVRNVLRPRPQGYTPLLTAADVRGRLQRAVSEELPRLVVFSHEELPRGVRVKPLGQVRLSPVGSDSQPPA